MPMIGVIPAACEGSHAKHAVKPAHSAYIGCACFTERLLACQSVMSQACAKSLLTYHKCQVLVSFLPHVT